MQFNNIKLSPTPKDIYSELFLKYKNNSKIFIESGTNKGESVNRALEIGYEKIVSIEPHPESFLFSSNRFKNNPKVQLINDFSENVLDKILCNINESCLVYLDGHLNSWFDQGTQPLIKELEILSNTIIKNHTIIIDDYFHMNKRDSLGDILYDINKNYRFDFYEEVNGILVASLL
jgi:hypothetical protein